MKLSFFTPPLTQLNTPYPATAYLTGYLRNIGHEVTQHDLGIELIHRIYTKEFLTQLFTETEELKMSKKTRRIFNCHTEYIACVETVIRFLSGKDLSISERIANRTLLPEGPRFDNIGDLEWAFGTSGTVDAAKHIATLFIEDIADYLRETTDPHFDLTKYAEYISNYAPTFDEIENELQKEPSRLDKVTLQLFEEKIIKDQPQFVGFSVPFPGCLYSALKCAQWLREVHPDIKIGMGGGFVNTELRSISDPRIFQYIDFLFFDDGELPVGRTCEYLEGKISKESLVRTLWAENGEIHGSLDSTENVTKEQDYTPDFRGLPLDKYFSLSETLNPMHRLWTNGKWNKMTMAHGCYWAKCAFCDTSLDYIKRYSAPCAKDFVDKMERVMAQTGESGFHFVDEALPPKLLKEVAQEILQRKLIVSYWGNIRFDKSFTPELCQLLSLSGCIAVSGGIEVASDRLLKLMNKGVTVEQVINTTRNLTEAGIMVHAYLMYGFPTETYKETIDALRNIRDMFQNGYLQSAHWHRYAMTAHSPSGKNPELYGVKRCEADVNPFCNNEIDYDYQFDYDLDKVGTGLSHATYNYMHGLGFDIPLKNWFK
ncbi:MAG: radical SAM protein [Paludibacteraceae bacterium]|nr:radical SAM protein [Paludibacteraceae bacterium]